MPYVQPTPKALLTKVRKVIRDNPERHNQYSWIGNIFSTYAVVDQTLAKLKTYALKPMPEVPQDEESPVCGTTGCVAGWAVILGDDPKTKVYGFWRDALQTPDGKHVQVMARARELLGLSEKQADYLFEGDRTREEVLEALDALIKDISTPLGVNVYKVTVTDARGRVVRSVQVEVDQDDESDEPGVAALEVAYQES
jgi:hypothetical protein